MPSTRADTTSRMPSPSQRPTRSSTATATARRICEDLQDGERRCVVDGVLDRKTNGQRHQRLARLMDGGGGAARASLLVRLAVPASSTELAARLGVSTAAVNQHLRALQAGGLLTSARYGRAVLYRRSALGDALLGDE